jgi:heme-degrading monooxygenase HmoA
MHFRPEEVPAFLEVFEEIKQRISSFEGCHKLELLRDTQDPNVYFTYSWWELDENLQAYRNSDFFADTWRRTKALFAEKAEAWSVELVDGVK